MDKQLLDEFLIKKIGDNYAIFATDKAYELLGLAQKQVLLENGIKKDAIEAHHYIEAFVNFLSNNYCIDGLVRVSRGNSHDASWVSEVQIFNKGGMWAEELNRYRAEKGGTYEEEPIIIDEEKITKEIIQNWAEIFDLSGDGEDGRLVYCSYNDNSARYCFSFEYCYLLGTASSTEYSKVENDMYTGSYICLTRKKG